MLVSFTERLSGYGGKNRSITGNRHSITEEELSTVSLVAQSQKRHVIKSIIYQSCGIAPSGNAPRVSAAAIEIGSKEKSPLAKTVRTCRKLLKIESALWTFVYQDGVEPTNNSAERALRPAVIWRNLSIGSQSHAGSEFVARMLTVKHSLKLQGRSVLDFLTQSCLAARLGMQRPSLIPAVQQSPIQNPRSLIFL